jgi:5-hydroxyisourate hydrolase
LSLSTHVLDTMRGTPAAGLEVTLSRREPNGGWTELASAETDADGRVRDVAGHALDAGDYRLSFATQPYFERSGLSAFFPEVTVVFTLEDPGDLHVPLLLSPFGYTTYKGV